MSVFVNDGILPVIGKGINCELNEKKFHLKEGLQKIYFITRTDWSYTTDHLQNEKDNDLHGRKRNEEKSC